MAETEKKGGLGRKAGIGCLILVGGIIGLGVLGSMLPETAEQKADRQTKEAAAAAPPQAVTATELANAYEQNEARAQQAYGGRRLAVTGIVSGVDLDMFDAPVVRLRGTNEFQDVQASFGKEFANETARLNKGDEVTVVCGKLTEVIGTPMLGDCTF